MAPLIDSLMPTYETTERVLLWLRRHGVDPHMIPVDTNISPPPHLPETWPGRVQIEQIGPDRARHWISVPMTEAERDAILGIEQPPRCPVCDDPIENGATAAPPGFRLSPCGHEIDLATLKSLQQPL